MPTPIAFTRTRTSLSSISGARISISVKESSFPACRIHIAFNSCSLRLKNYANVILQTIQYRYYYHPNQECTRIPDLFNQLLEPSLHIIIFWATAAKCTDSNKLDTRMVSVTEQWPHSPTNAVAANPVDMRAHRGMNALKVVDIGNEVANDLFGLR